MCLHHLSSSLHRESGSQEELVHANCSSHATLSLDLKRRSLERSLLSYVTKTPPWLEELVLPNLVNSLLSSRSNMFFKKFCQFSDNCLRMSKTQLESCASSLWSQWPNIFQRRRTKSIHLVLFWLLERISPGRLDLPLPRISLLLLILSEKRSLITILFKLSPSFWTITRLRWSMLLSWTSQNVWRTFPPKRFATWCFQLFKTLMPMLPPNSRLVPLKPSARWPKSLVRSIPHKRFSQSWWSSLRTTTLRSSSMLWVDLLRLPTLLELIFWMLSWWLLSQIWPRMDNGELEWESSSLLLTLESSLEKTFSKSISKLPSWDIWPTPLPA